MTEQEELMLLRHRFRIETVLLFTSSLINLIVILTVGFLIGPQIKETQKISIHNNEINKDNAKILNRLNETLNKDLEKKK